MRFRFLLPLALCLVLAGCASDDIRETGITRSNAVRIAEHASVQSIGRYGYVYRTAWSPGGRYWLVVLTDRDGSNARAYRVNPRGVVIYAQAIDRNRYDYGPSRSYYEPRTYDYRPGLYDYGPAFYGDVRPEDYGSRAYYYYTPSRYQAGW